MRLPGVVLLWRWGRRAIVGPPGRPGRRPGRYGAGMATTASVLWARDRFCYVCSRPALWHDFEHEQDLCTDCLIDALVQEDDGGPA